MGDRSPFDEQFSAPDTVRMMVDTTLHGVVGPKWVAPNVAEIKQWAQSGGDGYGARRWAESETLAHLKSTAIKGLLLSNDSLAAYLATIGDGAAHRSGGLRIDRLWDNIPPASHVVWFYAPRLRKSTDLMAFLAASQI